MVIVDELTPGRPLPAPMVVEVTEVRWKPQTSRRAEVELIDTAGNPVRLVDYEGANLDIEWEPNTRYRIHNCAVSKGGGGFDLELAPSRKTTVESLDRATETTNLLVIGDTHIGRKTHPRTGEQIDPLLAFSRAIEYGLDQDVDAVVHVGDIFHESATERQATLVQERIVASLADANVQFYYICGNHSARAGDEMLAAATGPYVSKLDANGVVVGDVRLFGLDHHPAGNLPWHAISPPTSVPESVSILVLHQTLEQLSGPGAKHVDVERLYRAFNRPFDFVVSGHHHDAIHCDHNGTPIMYTGAAERMSTNKDPIDRVAWLLRVRNGTVVWDRYDIP